MHSQIKLNFNVKAPWHLKKNYLGFGRNFYFFFFFWKKSFHIKAASFDKKMQT